MSDLKSKIKIVLAIIASSAAGKTTLRRTFTDQDAGADKHSETIQCYHARQRGYIPYKVKWTTFPNGTSLCGHPGTGADSNGNLDAINRAIDKCLAVSDFVIFDGVMSSKKLVEHLIHHPYQNLVVVWVYLDVSAETVLARLLARRTKNGETETSEKTKRGVLHFRKRAAVTWKYITWNYKREPFALVEIPEGPTPGEIHEALKPVIAEMQTVVIRQNIPLRTWRLTSRA